MHTDTAQPRTAFEALQTLESAGINGRAFLRFGEPCLSLKHDRTFLVVSLSGAQILEWSPDECNHPLWITDEKLHVSGSPIRGGIPLCWPWFGAAYPPFTGPGHGFGRRRAWTLVSAKKGADAVSLHFRLEISAGEYRLRADYHVSAGRQLALRLVTTNLGEAACPVTPAFHPYFAIGDIARTKLHVAASTQPRNRLNGRRCRATSEIGFTGEEQELEWTPWSDLELESASGSRLEIHSEDASHCVAWNPGPGKTAAISDLDADAFREFVCIEPARLDPDASTIPAGGSAELSMALSCAARLSTWEEQIQGNPDGGEHKQA